jgi:hypoxanthine-guanine phosphoribosyltransferase
MNLYQFKCTKKACKITSKDKKQHTPNVTVVKCVRGKYSFSGDTIKAHRKPLNVTYNQKSNFQVSEQQQKHVELSMIAFQN